MAAEQQRAPPAALGAASVVGVGVNGALSTSPADVCRTVMVIDGSYSYIGARKLPGGRIDFVRFREELERQAACRFRECWFFDHENVRFKSPSQAQSVQYTALKLAPPHGPQFQLKLYAMKKYSCHCRRCGHDFTQNVQKGVDNGIATKILSLAYENVCDRFVLFAGDGDFYDSLNQIKNVLRKDLWVVGYRETVSADLQQLASHVIWIDDIWQAVQVVQPQPIPAPQTSKVAVTLASEVHVPSPVEPVRPSRETSDTATSARRVRLERQANADNDSDVNGKSRGKMRNRRRHDQNRRNRSRSRSRSRSPRRQASAATTEENGEHPLFFFDTGAPKKDRQGPRAEASVPSSSAPPSKHERRDAERGRRGKRKRHEPPPLTFELSDMSSEEDEQHPPIQRGRADPESKQNGSITIINLASDSE